MLRGAYASTFHRKLPVAGTPRPRQKFGLLSSLMAFSGFLVAVAGAGIAQTVIRAPESTANIPSSRKGRDVQDRIMYLDPDAAPFTVILTRVGSKVTTQTKFEWAEKDLPARWDAVNSGRTGHSASGSPIGVENEVFFSIGDIIAIPRTGERMRVTSIDTTNHTLGVVRGVGVVSATALNNQDDILIIGNAYAEGSLSGPEKSHIEAFLYNYTQITRTPLGVTGSEEAVNDYFGDPRVRLRMEKGIEHKIDLERTFLFGERNIDTTSTDNPRRYAGGLLYFLQQLTNKAKQKDFGGIVTDAEVEDWMQDIFLHGSGSRLLLASPLWLTILDMIVMGRLQVINGRDTTYGVTVRQWISTHGTLNIVRHPLLENNPAPTAATATGFAGYAVAVDLDKVKYRPLSGRTTKLYPNIQANDLDGIKDEYLTECGLEVDNAQVHGVGYGATG